MMLIRRFVGGVVMLSVVPPVRFLIVALPRV